MSETIEGGHKVRTNKPRVGSTPDRPAGNALTLNTDAKTHVPNTPERGGGIDVANINMELGINSPPETKQIVQHIVLQDKNSLPSEDTTQNGSNKGIVSNLRPGGVMLKSLKIKHQELEENRESISAQTRK